MNNTRPISEHSRQELYDLIWSTSALKLEAHFGISSVAIAKHCKRLNVPRPGRGYWARIQAGQTPRKAPLPLTADESLKKAAQRRTPQTLSIPAATEPLLPLAAELLTALAKAELDHYKRTKLQKPPFPEVSVSKILVESVARAFHVLLSELQPFGIIFRKFQGIYHTGYFQRHGDRLYVAITEELVRPDGSRGVSLWAWPQEKANPCGYLTFSFRPGKDCQLTVRPPAQMVRRACKRHLLGDSRAAAPRGLAEDQCEKRVGPRAQVDHWASGVGTLETIFHPNR